MLNRGLKSINSSARIILHSDFIPNRHQLFFDFVLQLVGLCEQIGQLGGEAGHLFLKGLTVVGLLLNAHIPPRGEDVVLPGDLLGGGHRAEALDVLQRTGGKSLIGGGNLLDIGIGQLAELAGDHRAHLAGVDEEGLARLLFVFGDEPEGNRDLGGVEQLGRQGDDAVHQVSVHDVFADIALAARLRGEGAIGQHNTHPAAGGQVVDHVLDPGKVGVAGRRHSVLPADVVLEDRKSVV